jgi:septum site-determining protein MinC
MFRTRLYQAFAITPQPPIVDWLADLDASLARSNGFFAGHAVALDLSQVRLSPAAIAHLISNLAERNVRVLGICGVEPAVADSTLPPVLRGDCPTQALELPKATPIAPVPHAEQPTSLLIEDPVRSGQSVVFTEGDVTVLSSVGSGADIVAGGSIHIYGTLRGRAAAPWPASTAMPARVSSAAASRLNSWPSTPTTRRRTKLKTACAAAQSRLGLRAARSEFRRCTRVCTRIGH